MTYKNVTGNTSTAGASGEPVAATTPRKSHEKRLGWQLLLIVPIEHDEASSVPELRSQSLDSSDEDGGSSTNEHTKSVALTEPATGYIPSSEQCRLHGCMWTAFAIAGWWM